MNKYLKIIRAKYVDNYKIEIEFDDGKVNIVNFEGFLKSSSNPEIKKYLDKELFKNFSIVEGDLDWNDFDLIFPILDLYENSISKLNSNAA